MIRRALFEKKFADADRLHPRKDDMTSALSHARRHAEKIVPLLVELVERERQGFGETQMETSSIGLLMTLAPERATAIWEEWMRNDPREYVRVNAAHQLLLRQRTNDTAITVLCQSIDKKLLNKAYLLTFLGEAHPSSKRAQETLERVATTSAHPALRDEAKRSLARIRRRSRSLK